ncbi:MAG: redoxin domain-containing protein [Planctomycetales bacterium]|nr:redoxin domain-containing protein [Planctomycetales bacterium]
MRFSFNGCGGRGWALAVAAAGVALVLTSGPGAPVRAADGDSPNTENNTNTANDANAEANADAPGIGQHVDNFKLKDYLGADHELAEYADSDVVVLAFLGTECPLATLYTPRLVELADTLADRRVTVLGIASNQQDSVTELASFVRRHEVSFPVLKDLGNKLADAVGAERTPEVFVLDADRVVRYRGRIDDQYGFTGPSDTQSYQRPEPQRRDLAVAIDEVLAGEGVSQPYHKAPGCHIGRVRTPDADSAVTYSNQVARILNKNCVYCHRDGQIAPFSLTSYDEVAGWAEMIAEMVEIGRMPPWHANPDYGHFANDARLSDEEKQTLFAWVEAGAPEGDAADLPEPPQYAEGWLIPEPEQVIYINDEGYDVPADGVVDYQYFEVDPGWEEDTYISSIEARPGNAAVVHHILVFVRPPEGKRSPRSARLRDGWVGAYAPGFRPEILPPGQARKIPAGSKLLFQMHYTPNGSPQHDRSYIGLTFADPKTVEKEVQVGAAGNYFLRIPPHASEHEVESNYTFSRDYELISMMPHMHLRGSAFRYDAIYPDGTRETLLDVPHYDFGWQTSYVLSEPKLMPAGTRLHCIAEFDNSEDNLNNPDPAKEVRFGEQTNDEMMIGFFEARLAHQDLTQPEKQPVERVKEFLTVYRSNSELLDDSLTQAARRALGSEEQFEEFAFMLSNVVPQLDRVCVTALEDGKLRLYYLQERDGFHGTFRSTSTRISAEHEALATDVAADGPVVHHDLSELDGRVFPGMERRGVLSSLHVPGEKQGVHGTVNFWSRDKEAFPPEAVNLLSKAVALMLEGPGQTDKGS